MDPDANRPSPIECPLPWAQLLRRNLAEPRGELRKRLEAWLRAHGWRLHRRGGYMDPFDLDGWPLAFAARMTAIRLAQALLVERGWALTGGCVCGDSEWWSSDVWELQKPGTPGYRTLAGALRSENLFDQPVPSTRPLITRPPLKLVRGGKAV